MPRKPVYRRNLDDAPRPVAAMAKSWRDGDEIPFHMHRRAQLIHAVSGVMRIETGDTAFIVPPALALWMPPACPHGMVMRGHLEMRTVYIDEAHCDGLPRSPMLVEVGGLMRELILADTPHPGPKP